jgi:hypothetical protein
LRGLSPTSPRIFSDAIPHGIPGTDDMVPVVLAVIHHQQPAGVPPNPTVGVALTTFYLTGEEPARFRIAATLVSQITAASVDLVVRWWAFGV